MVDSRGCCTRFGLLSYSIYRYKANYSSYLPPIYQSQISFGSALPFVLGNFHAMNVPRSIATPAKIQKTSPSGRALLCIGKDCATENVDSQLPVKAQPASARTASGPTASLTRMKGTGPSPTPKLATKVNKEITVNDGKSRDSPKTSIAELVPIPAIDPSGQSLRPILSGRGVHSTLTVRLMADTMIVINAAADAIMSLSIATKYITTLLIPHSC